MGLKAELAREQRAFLRRSRHGWGEHLGLVRAFLGEGLRAAAPGAPVLILGAGSGLEIPWALAPANTVGWDGDPWSRVRTLVRHRRWPPWVFNDLTGGMAELSALAKRTVKQPWSGRNRPLAKATLRLAGLVRTLRPDAAPLRAWLGEHRPGTILAANVMGQFGVVATRAIEAAFGRVNPWVEDPDLQDPLAEALEDWTARCVRAFLAVLQESSVDLWLTHDRGVLFGAAPVTLGSMAEPWQAQLRAAVPLEVSDPLCGVDVLHAFKGRAVERHHRWLWPVAPDQVHVMEALRVNP